jgi:type II secretion system protein G
MLTGCASTTSTEDATAALESSLPYRIYVKYQGVERYPGDVVCGEYQSPDPWGNDAGFKPFAVVGGTPYNSADDNDMAIFCSHDANRALQDQLGIGPLDESNPAHQKVHADLRQLVAALEAFEQANGFYPSGDEGLAMLTFDGAQGKRAARVPEQGYIAQVPVDPWGRAYRYYSEPFGGVKGAYELWTLGADDVEGGTGVDADIYHKYLKYLDHVSAL